MKKTYDNYQFVSSSIDYSTIEDEITNHYKLGLPHSSNFMYLDIGIHRNYTILADNGSICFSMIIGQLKDGNFEITIMPNSITNNK